VTDTRRRDTGKAGNKGKYDAHHRSDADDVSLGDAPRQSPIDRGLSSPVVDERLRTIEDARRSGKHLTRTQLQRILDDPEPEVREKAALFPNLTAAQAEQGVTDQARSVRVAHASHPKVPSANLTQIVSDPDMSMRRAVASNPSLSARHVKKLLKDPDEYVRNALLRTGRHEHADVLLASKDIRTRLFAADKDLTPEQRDQVISDIKSVVAKATKAVDDYEALRLGEKGADWQTIRDKSAKMNEQTKLVDAAATAAHCLDIRKSASTGLYGRVHHDIEDFGTFGLADRVYEATTKDEQIAARVRLMERSASMKPRLQQEIRQIRAHGYGDGEGYSCTSCGGYLNGYNDENYYCRNCDGW
jgi:hypothetical protein